MRSLMQAALSMATAYHTPVDYWLSLPLPDFMEWAEVAQQMTEERRRASNQQEI
jgi:hypothetical protein